MRKQYVVPVINIIAFEVNLVTDNMCDVSY